MDPNIESMVYPLFYPYGTQGWHEVIMRRVIGRRNRKTNNEDGVELYEESNKQVSRGAYVKYRISISDQGSMHFYQDVDYFSNMLLIVM